MPHFGIIVVQVALERKRSTATAPCNADTSYNFFRCVESYFYKQHGCQFPWNAYRDLDLPVCSNYRRLHNILANDDRNKGDEREAFTHFDRTIRTKMECLPPCSSTKYMVQLEKWEDWRSGRSLQIVLSDFAISYKEEYLACDMTCIIGEIGGNLGFYLGGSILLILTLITKYTTQAVETIHKFYRRVK